MIIFFATMTVLWNMAICAKVGIYQIGLLKLRKQNMARVSSAASFVKDFEFDLETEQQPINEKEEDMETQ